MTTFNEVAFWEALETWRARPFERHTCTCYHFVADVLQKATGEVRDVPVTQDDESGYLHNHGFRNLYHAMQKYFGKAIPPLQAHIGYVVYRKADVEGFEPGEATLGIVGRGSAWFLGARGLEQVRLGRCARAFRTYDSMSV